VEPLRQPHREKMISKIQIIEKSWNECHQSLIPLVTVYEEEVTAKLAVMRANILEELGDFRDVEIKRLGFDQRKQRQALINAFREHMATYDLSEHSIFEKFNWLLTHSPNLLTYSLAYSLTHLTTHSLTGLLIH
jgi:hypothetical protein